MSLSWIECGTQLLWRCRVGCQRSWRTDWIAGLPTSLPESHVAGHYRNVRLVRDQNAQVGEARLRRIENIIGSIDTPAIADQLHHLAHVGRVEYIHLSRGDLARHRLRVKSSAGNEYGIALPRSQHLSNGAVLVLEADRAVVIRLEEEQWLVLEPRDVPAALELGYHAGNMHWRVQFDAGRLRIAIEGEEGTYLARLESLIGDRVKKIDVE